MLVMPGRVSNTFLFVSETFDNNCAEQCQRKHNEMKSALNLSNLYFFAEILAMEFLLLSVVTRPYIKFIMHEFHESFHFYASAILTFNFNFNFNFNDKKKKDLLLNYPQ